MAGMPQTTIPDRGRRAEAIDHHTPPRSDLPTMSIAVVNRGVMRAVAALAAGLTLMTGAAAAEPRAADAAAIRAAATAYREALERGDGAALTALWTPDGDIVDDIGTVLSGRDTAAVVGPPSAGPRPEIQLTETGLRFLADDVAIEDGIVEVRMPDGSTMDGHFTAVWVRHEGAWKIGAVREARIPGTEGPATLQALDWMVGDWIAVPAAGRGEEAAAGSVAGPIEVAVRWNASRTFLMRDMRIPPPPGAPEGAAPLEISQRIGWDPLTRQIRGWAFGSDGSHGDSTWTIDGSAWLARTVSVRPDGRRSATLVVYTPDGADRCIVQSLPTHVGGEHEPHLMLTMERRGTASGQPAGKP